jgi:AraC family transcriptional regulator, transcriptional activator of pobA
VGSVGLNRQKVQLLKQFEHAAKAQYPRMSKQLPSYSLYGEHGRAADIEWLHCESIAERSRLHNWEIRPHRHELLYQVLFIRTGRAELALESASASVRGPCVVTVPALSVHGFHFSSDVDGVVVTVLEQHLRRLLASEPGLQERLLPLRHHALQRSAVAEVGAAVLALREEYRGTAPWRALAIDAALLRLLLLLGRRLPGAYQQTVPHSARALDHVQRFRTLVELRFREQPALSVCAAELGITTTQLNRVCQQVLGHAALGELAYTNLSVKQIAFDLGFTDAAYFTRFFQRRTGSAPTLWRAAAAAA